jgi:tRNA pseudouridine38-40 synthase
MEILENNENDSPQRYFVHLAYKGTAYRGWQRQAPHPDQKCIQQVIEDSLYKMTKYRLGFMGCGRTDVGVHAMQYFGHFDYKGEWLFDPIERLNRMLPNDIRLYELIPVDRKCHTRYDAIRRTYEYHMHLEENPFLTPISTYYRTGKLDFAKMEAGMNFLATVTDFRHLCLTPDKFENTRCTMFEAVMRVTEDEKRIVFRFTANRYLKSMIRLMIARLVALGEGAINMDEFSDCTKNNQQFAFRTLAFPQGLYLTKVVYPYLERETKMNILAF